MNALDDYAAEELSEYVTSFVNPEHPPTEDPTDDDAYSDLMDHFLFLVRGQRKGDTTTDFDFTDIYHFLKSRPRRLRPPRSKFFEFGVEYSHETRLRWVKDGACDMLGLMNMYEGMLRDYKDAMVHFLSPVVIPSNPKPTEEQMVAKDQALDQAKTEFLESLDNLRTNISSLMTVVASDVYWGDAYSDPPEPRAHNEYGLGFVLNPVDSDTR
ncbi:hypothetical protein V8D89_002211 [Ganoderma adspersum]